MVVALNEDQPRESHPHRRGKQPHADVRQRQQYQVDHYLQSVVQWVACHHKPKAWVICALTQAIDFSIQFKREGT